MTEEIVMENYEIVLENAKNGELTCKWYNGSIQQYLYSKYEPTKSIKKINYEKNKDYVMLGLGLGYELFDLYKNTIGEIIVFDFDDSFKKIINSNIKLKEIAEILSSKRVKLFIAEEYRNIIFKKNYEIINNINITKLYLDYFMEVIKHIAESEESASKEKILFFEHITIADDVIAALKNTGIMTKKEKWYSSERMNFEILSERPSYLFTINLDKSVLEFSKREQIPYIAWIVDTPCYSLYNRENIAKNVYIFVYDKTIVEDLRNRGMYNVYYMPVAANIERLDSMCCKDNQYLSDVSFLGTIGSENEYNQYMIKKLTKETQNTIYELFNLQSKSKDYIINKLITPELIRNIVSETGYVLKGDDFLSVSEKLGFILGRKYNELERLEMVKKIGEFYKIDLYGDENWNKMTNSKIKYQGIAEHFQEMPRIFHNTKININLTRVYVESGLPMRVFDVMGAGGFLMTNYKQDISDYFEDGKDLVVFNGFDDMLDKIDYYLSHDEEREKIANNGYNKVKKFHTYEIRIKEIFKIIKS